MRRHDLTNKKTKTMTKTNTKTMTIINTFWEHPQLVTPKTFDLWDIWSEWWGNMAWPTKRQWQWQWQRQRQWQRHLEKTQKERPKRHVTIETFDQSDEETWPDQQKDNNKDKDNDKDIVTFETLITFLTIENSNLNIYSYPWIRSDRDSIRNSCDVFFLNF